MCERFWWSARVSPGRRRLTGWRGTGWPSWSSNARRAGDLAAVRSMCVGRPTVWPSGWECYRGCGQRRRRRPDSVRSTTRVARSGGCRCSWAMASRSRASDLAAILADAGRDNADYLYSDSVVSLTDDGNGVDVTFEHAAPRRFDLVVGADGLHSRVRELVFGTGFVKHLGLYVATVDLAGAVDDERTVLIHNTPGRAAAVHPATGRGIAAFIFRSDEITDSTTGTRPGSARSSPRRTPASGGGCPSWSNG